MTKPAFVSYRFVSR